MTHKLHNYTPAWIRYLWYGIHLHNLLWTLVKKNRENIKDLRDTHQVYLKLAGKKRWESGKFLILLFIFNRDRLITDCKRTYKLTHLLTIKRKVILLKHKIWSKFTRKSIISHNDSLKKNETNHSKLSCIVSQNSQNIHRFTLHSCSVYNLRHISHVE